MRCACYALLPSQLSNMVVYFPPLHPACPIPKSLSNCYVVRSRNFRDTESNKPCNCKRRVSVNGGSAVHRLSPIQPVFQPSPRQALVNYSSIPHVRPDGPAARSKSRTSSVKRPTTPGTYIPSMPLPWLGFFFFSLPGSRSDRPANACSRSGLLPLTELRYIHAVMAHDLT